MFVVLFGVVFVGCCVVVVWYVGWSGMGVFVVCGYCFVVDWVCIMVGWVLLFVVGVGLGYCWCWVWFVVGWCVGVVFVWLGNIDDCYW